MKGICKRRKKKIWWRKIGKEVKHEASIVGLEWKTVAWQANKPPPPPTWKWMHCSQIGYLTSI